MADLDDDSQGSYELGPPRVSPEPARVPPQPLPRLKYAPRPDSSTESTPGVPPKSQPPRPAPAARAKQAKPIQRGTEPAEGDEPRGVLIEATPLMDTYEARQRTRLVVGLALVGVLATSVILMVRALRHVEDSPTDAPPPLADFEMDALAHRPDTHVLEIEAQVALQDAIAFFRKDRLDLARQTLERVVANYPETAAAAQAGSALSRSREGLPLFVEGPLVSVSVETVERPKTDPEPLPVVRSATSAISRTEQAAEVSLTPPSTPIEPRPSAGSTLETANRPARALPKGFRPREGVGVHPSGWPLEITCDLDGAGMVLVPSGFYYRGRDDGPAEERPLHVVSLSTYYIDQHEVTIRQYRRFQDATGYSEGGPEPGATVAGRDEELPVSRVSARDALEYARWSGKTLPTEAQWEAAARTTDGRLFPWGTVPPDWQPPRRPGQIDPVQTFALDMSPYGAYDLAGNVREWTTDWFDPGYYGRFVAAPVNDPRGPARGQSRIPLLTIKGGSPEWYASRRDGMRPDARLPDLGFRCVLNLGVDDAVAITPPLTEAAESRVEATEESVRFPPGSIPF